ncbi:MAG: prolipoprotein diacylglyceryl transferase [Gammaproteobacteria bacterium]|nr:prolipoprotein diacylglyceryl transferase [Gammaproteobacteria bacterium]
MNYPEISPIIFSIGNFSVRWYSLMYVLGFASAWYLLRRRAGRTDGARLFVNWHKDDVEDLIFFAALGVIIGGRVGYVFFYGFEQFIASPLYLFMIHKGGMSFHGGLIGVIAAMAYFAKTRGRHWMDVTDFIVPATPLGLFFGRIGNFINGELWGKPTDVPWGIIYNGQKLHPSQLYEALLEGLVLFVMLWIYSARTRPRMAVSGLFLLGYGTFRFIIEFVRVPDADKGYLFLGWVTMGQILSAPMILAGALMLIVAYRSRVIGGEVAGQA